MVCAKLKKCSLYAFYLGLKQTAVASVTVLYHMHDASLIITCSSRPNLLPMGVKSRPMS